MQLTTKGDYFPIPNYLTGFYNGDGGIYCVAQLGSFKYVQFNINL